MRNKYCEQSVSQESSNFNYLVQGMEVVRLMEKDGSESGSTKHMIVVKDCGELA